MTDTPQVLLAYHLKTLKLPTFLREYDKLARQCAAEGVDHVRYLVRLTGAGSPDPPCPYPGNEWRELSFQPKRKTVEIPKNA
jgi:hypothetical protein